MNGNSAIKNFILSSLIVVKSNSYCDACCKSLNSAVFNFESFIFSG